MLQCCRLGPVGTAYRINNLKFENYISSTTLISRFRLIPAVSTALPTFNTGLLPLQQCAHFFKRPTSMSEEEELLASVRLVCAADERVAALSHVMRQIDAFRFNGQWTLERASKRGFVHKLALAHLRELNQDDDDALRTLRFRTAVYKAVKYGYDIRVLQWWLNNFLPEAKPQMLYAICPFAIRFGRLSVLKWLYAEMQGKLPRSVHAVDCFDPETAYWLYEHGSHLLVEFRMYDCSAADPSFEFAKWCLTEQDLFKCRRPEDAVSFAIDHNQLEYLQWIHEHRPELYQPYHLDRAVNKCQLEILKWLCTKFPTRFFSNPSGVLDQFALKCIDGDQTIKLIRWVSLDFNWQDNIARLTWMQRTMVSIAGTGKLDLFESTQREFQQLSQEIKLTSHLIDAAAANGHLAMVQWLHDRLSIPAIGRWLRKKSYAMNNAASNGHLDVLKWLHKNHYKGCSKDAMDNAAANGHIEVVKWLHANRAEGCTIKAMNLAAKHGHLKVLQWLHANRSEGCDRFAMVDAAKQGHTHVVRFLYTSRNESNTSEAMDAAAASFHFNLYKWLLEKLAVEKKARRWRFNLR